MDPHALGGALRTEAAALAVAADLVPWDRPVPGCPGMTVDDLVRHVGSVHRLVTRWVTRGSRPREWPRDPNGADPVDWYRIGAASLIAVLDPARASEPAATWCPWDRTLGFWLRRMAHETAVHRVDAQAAAGLAAPLDHALAVDGIEEVLRLWLGCHLPPAAHRDGLAITLRVPGREWTVALHEHVVDFCATADPAAVVSGSASAVDLWLWGRVPESELSVEGDLSVVRALRTAVAAATG
ncbi:maleylpyruvate isomerase family mycothiol-dependent enzyme [Saccharothrix sp.]|uniref:maleylpyruvate isomerase family mycothiol-dependent enzyme n=1 Tax=Saccharothrix sp. TaxID=1873460 RepID=UPI002810B410|nr:maleylpyruvate isomerase family mycothiol-dependent enzyme [Saccharothrix sp.]